MVDNIDYNTDLEILLKIHAEECESLSILHRTSYEKYSQRSNYINIPVIILSSAIGFATGIDIGYDRMNIILGVSSIFVGIIKSIDTYFQLGKRSEAHRLCSLQFQQINKKIQIELALKRDQRISAKDMLAIIKTDIKNLQDIAPLIDHDVIESFKLEYGKQDPTDANNIIFDAHTPNFCTGLSQIVINGHDPDELEEKSKRKRRASTASSNTGIISTVLTKISNSIRGTPAGTPGGSKSNTPPNPPPPVSSSPRARRPSPKKEETPIKLPSVKNDNSNSEVSKLMASSILPISNLPYQGASSNNNNREPPYSTPQNDQMKKLIELQNSIANQQQNFIQNNQQNTDLIKQGLQLLGVNQIAQIANNNMPSPLIVSADIVTSKTPKVNTPAAVASLPTPQLSVHNTPRVSVHNTPRVQEISEEQQNIQVQVIEVLPPQENPPNNPPENQEGNNQNNGNNGNNGDNGFEM